MFLKEKCHIGPVCSNNSASSGSNEEGSLWLSERLGGLEQCRLHNPQRGVADTDENGRCFEPCFPIWKLKERTFTVRDESTWRLFCFTWQLTKGYVSLVRMTVQEHDEIGIPFSSSRPLWASLVFIKAWALQKVLWSWGMIWPMQMYVSVMSPGAHGTVPMFRTKPCGWTPWPPTDKGSQDLHVGKCNTTFSFTSFGLI